MSNAILLIYKNFSNPAIELSNGRADQFGTLALMIYGQLGGFIPIVGCM